MKVLLTGVSCVGKSTIGAELAALIGIPFFDLDTEVEAFFQTSIGRLQAQCGSMHAYRTKACRVLKALLSRTDAQDCVIALPPSGLMVPYWNVVKGSRTTLVVVQDDPINILNSRELAFSCSRPRLQRCRHRWHSCYDCTQWNIKTECATENPVQDLLQRVAESA
jgi:shikimate kinase